MQVLIVHRHFWPSDLPYAQMLAEFVLFAREKGHEVSVLAPCVSNSDKLKRERWGRENKVNVSSTVLPSGQGSGLLRKASIYCRYLFWLRKSLKSQNPDVIWVSTTPPVLAAMLVRLRFSGSSARYIYHCQDIHPEASNAIGKLTFKPVCKWLRSVDSKNVSNAWRVIVLSEDMKKLLSSRSDKTNHIRVINNFVREDLLTQQDIRSNTELNNIVSSEIRPRWVFAGTMGHFQNLELLVDALLLVNSDVCPDVTFIGGGAAKPALESKVASTHCSHIRFLNAVSSNEAQELLENFDVGIVSLAHGVISCAYPSKVTNYLAAGVKIFAIVEDNSELANFITEQSLGAATSSRDAYVLSRDIDRFVSESLLLPDRKKCRAAAARYFGMQKVLSAYEELLHFEVDP